MLSFHGKKAKGTKITVSALSFLADLVKALLDATDLCLGDSQLRTPPNPVHLGDRWHWANLNVCRGARTCCKVSLDASWLPPSVRLLFTCFL